MVRRRNHRAQVVTSFVRIKEDLGDGKVRCNGCSKVVALTKTGRTYGHKTPAGEPCAYRAIYAERTLVSELPPVLFRGATPGPIVARPVVEVEKEAKAASRLDVGSKCEDCGRWLPGERHVCGRCSNARAAAKRRKDKSARWA